MDILIITTVAVAAYLIDETWRIQTGQPSISDEVKALNFRSPEFGVALTAVVVALLGALVPVSGA